MIEKIIKETMKYVFPIRAVIKIIGKVRAIYKIKISKPTHSNTPSKIAKKTVAVPKSG